MFELYYNSTFKALVRTQTRLIIVVNVTPRTAIVRDIPTSSNPFVGYINIEMQIPLWNREETTTIPPHRTIFQCPELRSNGPIFPDHSFTLSAKVPSVCRELSRLCTLWPVLLLLPTAAVAPMRFDSWSSLAAVSTPLLSWLSLASLAIHLLHGR